jgi:glutamate---cysteine ligase / carboxylate-amine ligase
MTIVPLAFSTSPTMSLGVEVELQLLDPVTMDLTPASPRVFERVGSTSAIKPEIFCSMLEIATGVCEDVSQVRSDLDATLGQLRAACRELGVAEAGGGAHPFARYRDRVPYPGARYKGVLEREQWIARRLAIFGLHIHLGMRDGDHAMRMMNKLLPYTPHLLALSAASPFWEGADTGLADARVTVFESMPTAGVPPTFARWADFEEAYEALVRTESIRSIKDLWWDIRPQPQLGTLELRICDTPQTLSEITALVAFTHCLAVWLDDGGGAGAPAPPRPLALWSRQNKWRVARHGLDAKIVTGDGQAVAPVRAEIARLLAKLAPIATRLGADRELAGVARILGSGAGYARQRGAFTASGSLHVVADLLVREFESDLPLASRATVGAA